MSKELTVVNNLMSLADMPREEIKRSMDRSFLAGLVRQHPNLDQTAFLEFINKCQLTGADPRLNQVYLLVHNAWNPDKKVAEPKGTTVFAYQFFIQMAQRTGQLEDFGVDTIQESYMDLMSGQERKSISAKAWVKRAGIRYEYKARFWEFVKTNKDGNLMGNWRVSPYLMLEKCAIANVMRWAFPESLSGIYTSDEISKDGSEPVQVQPVKAQSEALPAPKPINEYMKPAEAAAAPVVAQKEAVAPAAEPVVVQPAQAKQAPAAEKAGYKIDFAGRDIEDLRSELTEFLSGADQLLFDRIGKTREYMLEKVEYEKNLEGMKQKYSIIMRFM